MKYGLKYDPCVQWNAKYTWCHPWSVLRTMRLLTLHIYMSWIVLGDMFALWMTLTYLCTRRKDVQLQLELNGSSYGIATTFPHRLFSLSRLWLRVLISEMKLTQRPPWTSLSFIQFPSLWLWKEEWGSNGVLSSQKY